MKKIFILCMVLLAVACNNTQQAEQNVYELSVKELYQAFEAVNEQNQWGVNLQSFNINLDSLTVESDLNVSQDEMYLAFYKRGFEYDQLQGNTSKNFAVREIGNGYLLVKEQYGSDEKIQIVIYDKATRTLTDVTDKANFPKVNPDEFFTRPLTAEERQYADVSYLLSDGVIEASIYFGGGENHEEDPYELFQKIEDDIKYPNIYFRWNGKAFERLEKLPINNLDVFAKLFQKDLNLSQAQVQKLIRGEVIFVEETFDDETYRFLYCIYPDSYGATYQIFTLYGDGSEPDYTSWNNIKDTPYYVCTSFSSERVPKYKIYRYDQTTGQFHPKDDLLPKVKPIDFYNSYELSQEEIDNLNKNTTPVFYFQHSEPTNRILNVHLETINWLEYQEGLHQKQVCEYIKYSWRDESFTRKECIPIKK